MLFPSTKTAINTLLGITIGLSVFCVPATTQANQFYKWVDQNGSTHYTLTPPPANAKRLPSVMTYDDKPRYTPPPIAPTEPKPEPEALSQSTTENNPEQSNIPLPTTHSPNQQTPQ